MTGEIPTCPECGAPLLQHNERDGAGLVLRAKLLKIADDGAVQGQCRKCRRWVDLPLRYMTRPVLFLRT